MKKTLFLLFLFSSSLSIGQSWAWTTGGSINGFPGDGWPQGSAIDKHNNVYVTGVFQYSINFDSTLLTDFSIYGNCNNHMSGFIAKYAPDGNLIWAKQISYLYALNSGCQPSSIAVDKSGNIFLCGKFTDTISIGSNILIAIRNDSLQENSFIAKFDSSGNVIWVKQSTSSISDYSEADAISIDNSGHEYILGDYSSNVKFGAYSLSSTAFNVAYIAKYDSAGNIIWLKQIPAGYDSSQIFPSSCVFSEIGKGYIYLAGAFDGNYIFGMDTLKTNNGLSIDNSFLMKIDTAGNFLWERQGKGGFDWGWGVTSDNSGSVFTTGNFQDTVAFNSTIIQTTSESGIFIAKYDSSGSLKWVKNSTESSYWTGYSLSSDNHNNIYIGAYGFGSSMSLGSYKFVASPSVDTNFVNVALIKLDSSGNTLCGSSVLNYMGSAYVVSDTSGNYVYLTSPIYWDDSIYGIAVMRWVSCSGGLGVNDINEENGLINVYPNPNDGVFTVFCHSGQSEESLPIIQVYNILGQQVIIETLRSAQGDNSIDLSNQPNGVYMYRVTSESGVLVGEGKVVIQK